MSYPRSSSPFIPVAKSSMSDGPQVTPTTPELRQALFSIWTRPEADGNVSAHVGES